MATPKKATTVKAVALNAVKARRYLVIFSNGCKAIIDSSLLPVYEFQRDHARGRVSVIDIEEVA